MAVYGVGINNMGKGWATSSELNKRIYRVWVKMLERCYSTKFHKYKPTYKECEVCERWHLLSNFVQDIVYIEGYQDWVENKERICLDKDVKGKGSKTYSLETCCFISNEANIKESNNRNNILKPVIGVSVDRGTIKSFETMQKVTQEGFSKQKVCDCCKGRRKTHKGYIWMYLEDYIKLQQNT